MATISDQTSDAIAAEVAALASMTHKELRLAWRQYYKTYPPKFVNRNVIELGVAWKIQERAFGGLVQRPSANSMRLPTSLRPNPISPDRNNWS